MRMNAVRIGRGLAPARGARHCPGCGLPLVHEGGCVLCRGCGYSPCP